MSTGGPNRIVLETRDNPIEVEIMLVICSVSCGSIPNSDSHAAVSEQSDLHIRRFHPVQYPVPSPPRIGIPRLLLAVRAADVPDMAAEWGDEGSEGGIAIAGCVQIGHQSRRIEHRLSSA